MKQIHKRFNSKQVGEIIKKYEEEKIERTIVEQMLEIGKAQFFGLVKEYRVTGEEISIEYKIEGSNNEKDSEINERLRVEL